MPSSEENLNKTLQGIRELQRKGDRDKARAALENLQTDDIARHPAFKSLYGMLLIETDEKEKGKALIDEALKRRPQTSAWASDLGRALFLMGRPDQALEMLEMAVSLPHSDAVTFNRLGATYTINGNIEGAERAFREAVLRDPDLATVHSNLGTIMVQLGKLEEALEHYERALKLKPDLPQAASGRSALLVAMERAEEAVIDLEDKLEEEDIEPEDAIRTRRHLARILNAAGRYDAVSYTHLTLPTTPYV